MRILQVVHSFPPYNLAGTEIYTYNLSKQLSREHEVFVFHRISNLRKKEYELTKNNFDGLDVFTINNTFRFCDSFEKFYKNDNIAKLFIEVLDKVKPDIVHIQHLIFLSTTIISEIKNRDIPIVFTLHDYWLICPQWHFLKKDLTLCKNNDLSQCEHCLDYQLGIKKIPKRIYLVLRNIIPGFLLRFSKNIYLSWTKATLNSESSAKQIKARISHMKDISDMVNVFIAPSQFIKKKFIKFGVPEYKIKVIPHGVDTQLFSDFKRRESNKIRFGFIGTILPAKGLDILIKAFNMIGNNSAELKIYGNLLPYKGFEYYPRFIKRLVRNKKIKFMGEFNHNHIADIFSEIDVLVLPSIWYENSPLVILESLMSKTPVIASNIGGIPEIIQDGKNGFLFHAGHIQELYQKIKLITNTPELITILGQNIQSPKSIEENVQEIGNIYLVVLIERNRTCTLF